jgi:redox-sensitive bicupin YhaK (pirin superfamily)
MFKKVKYLIPAEEIDMGGIAVKQTIPTHNVNQIDPFLLLHHGKFEYTNKAPALQQGIGPHPHRGFSPVTFIIDGEVHHRDSRGNNQIAKKGEVQWMHAGAGIIHSERPSQDMVDNNGIQEVIQLWINSPSANKLKQPRYQFIPKNDIPVFLSEDKLVSNKLIAGSLDGLQGGIITESELLIVWGEASEGGTHTFNIDKGYNSMVYVIKGDLKIAAYGKVEKESLIVFDNNDEDIRISASSELQYLLLAGVAINEKMVHHGPFVMNSETEIMEAMRDYQMGKMGILIEEK